MNKGKIVCRTIRAVLSCAGVCASVCIGINLLFSVFAAASTVVLAGLLDALGNNAGGPAGKGVLLYAAAFLGLQAARRLLGVVSEVAWNVGVDEKCRYHFQMKLNEKAASLPYISFEETSVQEMAQRAGECVSNAVLCDTFYNILTVMECILTIGGLLAVMVGFSIWYLPVLILALIPYLVSRICMGKEFFRLRYFQAGHVRRRDYYYSLFSNPGPQKEQRVFGFGEYVFGKWEKERDAVAGETVAFRKKDSRRLAVYEALVLLGYLAAIGLSVILLTQGDLSIGVFGAGIFAFRNAQESTRSLFSLVGSVFGEVMDAENYFGFLDMKEEKQGTRRFSGLTERITVKNLVFRYPNAVRSAVEVARLEIRKGERVVLVGENGCGKTTLVKLLLGLYQPEQGQVLFDGIPVGDYSREDMAAFTSAVPQDFTKYHLPIRQAIGLHSPKAAGDDAKISSLLGQTGLGELSDPAGFDQWLGREFDGKELSGGQWQRLAIAQALSKDSQILFLDEPTSALDPTSEYEILSSFAQMTQGKTAVIVSHRVGLCRIMDKVIYMRDGKISGVGTHDELMQKNQDYANLYHEQAKWYQI